MIKSIKHKALRRFWETGNSKGLNSQWLPKLELVMDTLDGASKPEDLDAPGFRFHALKGNMKGRYAVTVTANWRLTFAFEGEDATEIDLEDYH